MKTTKTEQALINSVNHHGVGSVTVRIGKRGVEGARETAAVRSLVAKGVAVIIASECGYDMSGRARRSLVTLTFKLIRGPFRMA